MTGAFRHFPADRTRSVGWSLFGHIHTTGLGPFSGRHGRASVGSGMSSLLTSRPYARPVPSRTALDCYSTMADVGVGVDEPVETVRLTEPTEEPTSVPTSPQPSYPPC